MTSPESEDEGRLRSEEEANADADDIQPMSFNIFVLSLNASALIHLGEAPGGRSSEQVDLSMARQTIDILGLLEDKTRGNLNGEEERLLHQVLFDLRMRYTRKAERKRF
jgi:hypothetical protein